jgi:quercetin dioxygenase-like cupin family protein
MTRDLDDVVEFDEIVALALGELATGPAPRPSVKAQLMARIAERASVPAGYAVRVERDDDWMPHPVPGIRMKVLAVNRQSGYATLLLDVQPGTRFPAHHHDGDEECYVVPDRSSRSAAASAPAISSTPTAAPNTARCGPMKALACSSSFRLKTTCASDPSIHHARGTIEGWSVRWMVCGLG